MIRKNTKTIEELCEEAESEINYARDSAGSASHALSKLREKLDESEEIRDRLENWQVADPDPCGHHGFTIEERVEAMRQYALTGVRR